MAAQKKPTPKPQTRQADKTADMTADDVLVQTRKEYVARSRETLRVRVLPALMQAIGACPAGPTQNKLREAHTSLLSALEDLSS